jgi:hypothetical protein
MDSGIAALLGALVGGSFSYLAALLQWRQQKWVAKNDRAKELFQKRLVALQNCVKLIDFLVASKNATLGPVGHKEWVNMRVENSANGAFFPPELGDGFKALIRQALLRDDLRNSEQVFDWDKVEQLREDCLAYIQREFESGA